MLKGSLTLARGDDATVGLTILNVDGSPYNLSGCTLTFVARETQEYFSPVLISGNVTGHLDPTNGVSQVTFVPTDTKNLDQTTKYFDIKLLNISGKISTLVYGDFFVIP